MCGAISQHEYLAAVANHTKFKIRLSSNRVVIRMMRRIVIMVMCSLSLPFGATCYEQASSSRGKNVSDIQRTIPSR